MKKIPLLIIIGAILTGAVGFYYYQKNIYSKGTLKLEILGKEEVGLLEEVEYIVKYKNNGDTDLEEPELIFEFPQNSILTDGGSLRQTLGKEELGEVIYPGQEKTLRFKARLLGPENQDLTAKATLSYQPKNLRARYESNTTFTAIMKRVPLTFDFDLPSKIESGKEFIFRLNYFSNIDYPLSDLRVQAEYPSDFEFVQSNPKGLEDKEWTLGLLNKAEGGRIEITGRVSGDIGQEKVFRAKIGTWQTGEFVLLKETVKAIEIVQPALLISQKINNNPEYVASPADLLHYEISFSNIGESPLANLFLVARLEGEAFDFSTLKSPRGSFEQGDNSIVFDYRRVPELQFLDAGEEGKVEFWIELKDSWQASGKNQVIRNRVYLSQAREEFVTKVNAQPEIIQKGFFQDEVFGNSGPLPPRVGQTTTYTIMWQAKNYYNDVKNTKVKAVLPSQVELTGLIFPEEESSKFSFDSGSREIVWNVGDMILQEGDSANLPNIAFQIAFRPIASQQGATPAIIGPAKITAEDTWTARMVEAEDETVTTLLPDDPTINPSMAVVQ